MNSTVHKLIEDWPGEIAIVNGRARHPQSQGLVERGNAKVEEMLACRFVSNRDAGSAPWTTWLPDIQCKSWHQILQVERIITADHVYRLCMSRPVMYFMQVCVLF